MGDELMEHVLSAFGVCWMCVAAIFGLALGVRQEAWLARLDTLAQGGKLLEHHREFSEFRGRVTVHAHAFLFSVICVVVSLVMNRLMFARGLVSALAWAFIAATVIWSTGALARFRPMMALGDFVFLAALLVTAFGLVRALL
jgi:hypothetical protein